MATKHFPTIINGYYNQIYQTKYAIVGPNVDLSSNLSGANFIDFNLENVSFNPTNFNNIKAYDVEGQPNTLDSNYSWIQQPLVSGAKYALVGPNVDLSSANLGNINFNDLKWIALILLIQIYQFQFGNVDLNANLTGADISGCQI